jgi:hypothetical protein|tara:strand:+ start:128 stop:586 length:459 start_codon:yes stop_codon:yes gene_type:complete
MKIIKIFYLLLILVISGCGFQPLYKIDNEINFSIDKIIQSGNKSINRKIISKINNTEKKDIFYNLTIDSKETEEVLNKDQLGNIILTKLSIEVNIILTEPTNEALVFKEKKFISQYVYKNNENKFESSQTIRIKKDDLINKITENILIFLRF